MSVFICGTDTDVGKTLVSSALLKKFSTNAHTRYWKPVQTGKDDNDLFTVRELSGVQNQDLPIRYHFSQPLSPHRAAELDNAELDFTELMSLFNKYKDHYDLIVEGAGGLIVPLNRKQTWLDFLTQTRLPVILVARTGLGTINHTLLSLTVLAQNSIPVSGIFFCGAHNADNIKTICEFSGKKMLGHLEYNNGLVIHDFFLNKLPGP